MRAHRRRNQPNENHRDRYDWITLWTAIFGVALVALSTGIAAYQTLITRQELEQAIAQQRAWLTINVELAGDPVLSHRVGRVPVRIKTTNVGNLPASDVRASAILIAVMKGEKGSRREPRDINPCQSAKGDEEGFTVFPEQSAAVAEVDPAMLSGAKSDEMVGYLVTACVVYKTGIGRKSRETKATFVVGGERIGEAFLYGPKTDPNCPIKPTLNRIGSNDSAD